MNARQSKDNSYPRSPVEGLWVLGNYYFNIYLLKGDRASAIIEAGVSAVVDEVIRQLESLRIDPTFLVVTHPHGDHVTGLEGLRARFPDLQTVAAEGAGEFLSHPKAAESIVRDDRHVTKILADRGIKPGRPPIEEAPELGNHIIVGDGDETDLGGLTMRYLDVGGHSPGNIVVHVPEIDALMISDSLGFRFPGRSIFPLFLTDYLEYVESLERLEKLNARIVGPAHQGIILGPEAKSSFREARESIFKLRDMILTDDRDPEETARDVFEIFYKDECLIYTRENIMTCARLLVRRARESC
jgi:glyoxylase-like metal-dependent hydrolase (beta-lactamase superfamily II)